ncbi:MAG TPA: hypothetical protein VH641_01720 [Streptosporangiaceae bacterium]|jgi:hypothetical protein
MSFIDRLMIWLHVAFVIFAIGPVTIATLASPRYIRVRNVGVLRYLLRTTRIFSVASLGVLLFGIIAAQQLHKLGSGWVAASMTLFVVALVLLVVIMRDQRRAVVALEAAHEKEALSAASNIPAGQDPDATPGEAPPAEGGTRTPTIDGPNAPAHTANVERGRIASMAGIVTLIWLAILVLMIWNS